MVDHYRALGLSHRRADGPLTANDIKQAYRRALLRHHPDKTVETSAQGRIGSHPAPSSDFTVDQITAAFKTLSDPGARAEYDRHVKLAAGVRHPDNPAYSVSLSGLDVVDLDDLDYDETAGLWFRSCRCGQERAFIVTEDELDEDARYGELITGCRGCSLWLKVLFQAVDQGDATP